MSTYDSRIVIEPAENGYIVTVETDDGTSVNVFTRRRQLMHTLVQTSIKSNQTIVMTPHNTKYQTL